ncbi:MAG: NAD-dependent epimerase/dehydratase family protein [Desulfobacterales bacterium]|nr:NAD-dependent epimerase/dehydratase family protein [Desulfobacterales bacterium]
MNTSIQVRNGQQGISPSPQQVLVTGGGGFLGFAIVRKLIQRGDHVRSFSRSRYDKLHTLGVTQVTGDIADPEAVSAACQGMDLVIHTAAKPGVWGDYETFHQTNTVGTINIINACRRWGVDRLVHTSSPSVVFNGSSMEGANESVPYPDHYLTHYPKTKAMAEQAVRRAADDGLKTVCLRPHLIWGPEDNHLTPRIIARAKRLRRVGDGKNRVDTIYVDNAADAHLLAADALAQNPAVSGRVYFISQNDPIPLWDMVDHILHAAGLDPVRGSVSPGTARAMGAVLEWIYGVFGLKGEPPMTRFVAEELATAHWFDITAAQKDLGYEPKVSTKEGLKRLAAWFRMHPQADG